MPALQYLFVLLAVVLPLTVLLYRPALLGRPSVLDWAPLFVAVGPLPELRRLRLPCFRASIVDVVCGCCSSTSGCSVYLGVERDARQLGLVLHHAGQRAGESGASGVARL